MISSSLRALRVMLGLWVYGHSQAAPVPADWVLVNGKIYTTDAARSWVSALASCLFRPID